MNYSSIQFGRYGGNLSHSNVPPSYRQTGGTSFSAIPKVWSKAAPARFQPFFSPQALSYRPPTDHFVRNAYEGFPNRFRPPPDSAHRKDYEESISEAFSFDEGSEVGQDNGRSRTMQRDRKEPVSLHMWIISPVEDRQEICVEGKRSILDEEFWHSDVIRERLDEKTVMTVTGSIYRLEGNMELMDAMALGFSRSLVEAFWLGFPPDWKALIDNHFQTLSRLKEAQSQSGAHEDCDSDDDVSFVDSVSVEDVAVDSHDDQSVVSDPAGPSPARSADSDDAGPDDADPDADPPDNLDEVDGADMDVRSISEDEDDDILVSELATDSQPEAEDEVVVHRKVIKPPRTLEAKEHVLSKWIIKFLAKGKGIYVVGENVNGSLWHSSAIEKRLSQKKVLSCTGSVYKLVGKMDKLLALNEDFPIELYNKFQQGFPKEWQEMIQNHICGKSNSGKKSKILDKPKNKMQDTKTENKNKTSRTVKTDKNNKNNRKDSERKKSPAPMKSKPSSANKKNDKTVTRSTKKPITKEAEKNYESGQFVITPRGQLVDLSTLGRSRSGRLIKPPLHNWARQQLSTDGDQVVVKATTAGASKFLKQFEDQFKNISRKITPYFNPRQKDVDYSLLRKPRSNNTTLSTSISSIMSGNNRIRGKLGKQKSAESDCVSSSEAQLSEDTDNCEDQLNSDVTSIIEKNKSKRKQNQRKQRRLTCYNSVGSNPNDTISKGMYELDDSVGSNDRTVVTEECKTDNTGAQCNTTQRLTRQRSRENVTHNTDTDHTHKPTRQRNSRQSVSEGNNVRSSRRSRHSNIDSNHNEDLEAESANKHGGKKQTKTLTIPLTDVTDSNFKLKSKPNVTKLKSKEVEMTSSVSRSRRKSHGEETECSSVKDDDVPRRRSGRVKQKHSYIINSDNDSTEEEGETKPHRNNNKKNKTKIGATLSKDLPTEDTEDRWSKDEKQKLNRACKTMPVSDPDYWEKVADIVETKSADSCNKMFYQCEKNRPPTKPKSSKKEKPRATAVTAKSGTLKRKQQIKDILTQQNENPSEDLFDSTPYRKTRKKKIPLIDEGEDNIFDKIAKLQGKKFETPRGPGQLEGSIIHPMASPVPTPGTHLKADSPAQERDMEGYVHNILKNQKVNNRKRKCGDDTPKPKRSIKGKPPSEHLLYKLLNESRVDKENHIDSEHEEDYYFEGEEQETSVVV